MLLLLYLNTGWDSSIGAHRFLNWLLHFRLLNHNRRRLLQHVQSDWTVRWLLLVWILLDHLCQLTQFLLHLLDPARLLLPEQGTCDVWLPLLLGHWQPCEHLVVSRELILIDSVTTRPFGCPGEAAVRSVEEDVLLVQHEEYAGHPVNINVLLSDVLHQVQPSLCSNLSLHRLQQLLLQLLLWRGLSYPDGMDFSTAWHVDLLANDRVHELDGADGAGLCRHEELVADHLLVHGLSVGHISVDLVPEVGVATHLVVFKSYYFWRRILQ